MSPPADRRQDSDHDDGSSFAASDSACHASEFSFGSSSSISTTASSTSSSYSYLSDHAGGLVRGHKPHKAQQLHCEVIRQLRRDRNGHVDLHHFQLLRRLGGGDIGNVYLCRLRSHPKGLPECFYAMKVVDREALAARKKLVRAETEREILGMLDHPFLPTLYAHFHASHYSCSLIEFCPGGDLHSAQLGRPGRKFSISATK